MKKTNEFRDLVAKEFIRCVNESPREWKQGWFTGKSGRARNAATDKPYKGINLFYLKMVEMQLGVVDNRWATFKQIKDKGWKLQKGSKGYKVEYWFPLNFDSKTGRRKAITWNEYAQLEDDEKKECTLQCKYFTVFNASQIEGIPEIKLVHNDISESEVVEKISKGLGVDIEHSGGDMAYYSPGKDKIFLPLKETFFDDYEYNSTALHELGHSTAAEHRLNRDLSDNNYAYEELVAEITSCFMGEYISAEMTDSHFENHKAYIANWANEIEDDNAYLINAIKDAEAAADYMIEKGELDLDKDATIETQNKSIYIEPFQVDFIESYEKFGIRLSENLDIQALDIDGAWETWITKDGKCIGNTDQLNIWFCDRNVSNNHYVNPSVKDLENLFNEINSRLPKESELSILDCVDKEDLQELEGGKSYLKRNVNLEKFVSKEELNSVEENIVENEKEESFEM